MYKFRKLRGGRRKELVRDQTSLARVKILDSLYPKTISSYRHYSIIYTQSHQEVEHKSIYLSFKHITLIQDMLKDDSELNNRHVKRHGKNFKTGLNKH